nr:hypothetical protein EOBFOGIL_00008 [Escherichia coli]WOL85002.1 hypothetical protein LCGCLEKF_00008 [Escherichia coli]
MQSQPTVNDGLPGIDAWTVGAVVIRLEPLAGQQFRVRDQEVKLQPSLILMLDPQYAVLVFIEAGHQNPLKTRHQLFPLTGGQILFGKRQHPGGIFFGIG